MHDCPICAKVAAWRRGENDHVIQEFEHSIFVIGDHQFHKGYSLVLLKEHVRDMHELPEDIQTAYLQEVMRAGKAIVQAFSPWKMNYACYGNQVPHLHWHLFPRYETDPDHLNHPWLHASEFERHQIDSATAQQLSRLIRVYL